MSIPLTLEGARKIAAKYEEQLRSQGVPNDFLCELKQIYFNYLRHQGLDLGQYEDYLRTHATDEVWRFYQTRIKIINEIKALYQNNKEKCNQILDKEGYYDIIFEWPRTKKKGNSFETIPLCWKGPYSYYNSNTWVLLSEFVIKDDVLFVGYYNYHSGPPDYGYMSLESVPNSVLAHALYLIKKGLDSCDIVLPASLLLIKVDLRSISKIRLFNRKWKHGSGCSTMNINATFYIGENVYSVVSDQYEELEKTDYCWYFEGDSDGWMNFPEEFNHPLDALFIDLSKVPMDVTAICVDCQEESGATQYERKAIDTITDRRFGINYSSNERIVEKDSLFCKRIKLTKREDCWCLSLESN